MGHCTGGQRINMPGQFVELRLHQRNGSRLFARKALLNRSQRNACFGSDIRQGGRCIAQPAETGYGGLIYELARLRMARVWIRHAFPLPDDVGSMPPKLQVPTVFRKVRSHQNQLALRWANQAQVNCGVRGRLQIQHSKSGRYAETPRHRACVFDALAQRHFASDCLNRRGGA